MRKLLLIVCVVLLSVSFIVAKRTTGVVRGERQRATTEITETTQQINDKDREIANQLNELNSLSAQIEEHTIAIDTLQRAIALIDSQMVVLNDSIVTLEAELGNMREQYAQTLRDIRSRRRVISDFAFIFSSKSFQQAFKRVRYLQQFSRIRKDKAQEIRTLIAEVEQQRNMLTQLQNSKNIALASIEASRTQLREKESRSKALLATLRGEERRLKRYLRQQQQLVQELDDEIDRILAEERRQAEERRRQEELRRQEEERRRQEEERRRREEVQAATQSASPTQPSVEDAPAPSPTTPPQSTTPPATDFDAQADNNRVITGSFAANKGKLLFPVSGKYRIVCKYGQKKHAASKIEIVNKGIDIEVPSGAQVRAIYDGVVKIVTNKSTLNTVVIITHGDYITLYTNLDNVTIKPGDKVKANQSIGTICTDASGRGVLHFEMRKGSERLDPLLWVK